MGYEPILRRPRRPYRQIERRYVVEYVLNRYPKALLRMFNVRLGIPTPIKAGKASMAEYRVAKLWAPFADAIVVLDNEIRVIETKIRYPRHGIGALKDYVRRVPETPTLQKYLPNRNIIGVLVTPLYDPDIERTCKLEGIVYDVYTPCWVLEYMVEVKLLPYSEYIRMLEENKCIR